VSGNAYRQTEASDGASLEPLPTHWAAAVPRFRASGLAHEYLGKPFTELFATVKQGELDEFNSWITPLEIGRYLGPI
jgi:glutamine synthetase